MSQELESPDILQSRLLGLVSLSTDYCLTLERSETLEKEELIATMLNLLPRIYWEFLDIDAGESWGIEGEFFASYLDEDYYDSIRRNLERILGEDDVYLETFEQDMKYSESPISSSISESLADIFQPLFNFVSIVRDSEGGQLVEAFINCKELFAEYWSQTLCNVLRALNNIYFRAG